MSSSCHGQVVSNVTVWISIGVDFSVWRSSEYRTGPNRRLAGILRCRRPLSFKLRPANVSSCFLWSTMASVSIPACTGALLLDIEGTTTPITFVKVNLWLGSSLRGRAGYGYANGCLNTMKTTDFFFTIMYYHLSIFI